MHTCTCMYTHTHTPCLDWLIKGNNIVKNARIIFKRSLCNDILRLTVEVPNER